MIDTTAQTPTPTPKRRRRFPTRHVIGYLLVAIVLYNTGKAEATVDPNATTSTPVATVTVPGPTETIAQTPESCISALDAGDRTLSLAVQGFNIVSDSFDAVSKLDVDRLNANNRKLNSLTPKVTSARSEYDDLSAQCRAAN